MFELRPYRNNNHMTTYDPFRDMEALERAFFGNRDFLGDVGTFKTDIQDKSYVRCERSYGSYARSFDISGVKAEGIKASYNDGVLSLTLPKKDVEVSGSRRLAIE